MPRPTARVRALGFHALVAGGALLALTMLIQTVIGYRYVTGNLLLQEGRREGERVARQIEETLRSGEPRDPVQLARAVDEVYQSMPGQAAWIVVVDDQNQVLASRGRTRVATSPADRRQALDSDQPFARRVANDGTPVIVSVLPCRCSVGGRRRGGADVSAATLDQGRVSGPPRGPTMVEVALYPDRLSAPFARVRRQAAINALTACALLASMIALGVRFRGYVRGKQIEAQLDAARRVQRELMPMTDARIPGVELAADYSPALHVGGDVVDVLHLPGGRLGFMLGDVSGKGVSAALVMGLVQGALTASAADLASNEPERAIAAVNDLLLAKTSGARFASLFWCAFDPSDATLRYVNAGHPPAFLIRAGGTVVERLDEGGPVLGVISGAPYRSGRTAVVPGDLLVTYSDGIAEAANHRDDEFGLDRIVASVREHDTSSARGICDAVLEDVERFAPRQDGRDDRTLLVVRFTTGCAAFATTKNAA